MLVAWSASSRLLHVCGVGRGLWALKASSLLAGNDSGGECGVAVAKRFIMPDREAAALENRGPVPSNAPFWYSFEYGAAHFTVISTEHDFHKHSDQRKVGLKQDTDRCSSPE